MAPTPTPATAAIGYTRYTTKSHLSRKRRMNRVSMNTCWEGGGEGRGGKREGEGEREGEGAWRGSDGGKEKR